MIGKDIYDFYNTSIGRGVKAIVRQYILNAWKDIESGEVVIAFGYGNPYLTSFFERTKFCFNFLPQFIGAEDYPVLTRPELKKSSVSAVVDPLNWPLVDGTVDYLLMVHSLEFSKDVDQCLKEAWRTLKVSGEMIIILPNKHGPWANLKTTPLGQGNPYSYPRIYQILEDRGFEVLTVEGCIHFWPLSFVKNTRTALKFDSINRKIFKGWPGVWGIRVKKKAKQLIPIQERKHSFCKKLQVKT